jgi:CNT family concentrative nucleoside transporter
MPTPGTEFLFGASEDNPLANTFALGALPVIIFFAALVSILYHLGIMQRVVRWVGGAIGFVTGISKVEALGAAANIFVGQSESPLVVRPVLAALAAAGAVHADDLSAWLASPGRSCRLRRPARDDYLRSCSPPRSCRPGRASDGQDLMPDEGPVPAGETIVLPEAASAPRGDLLRLHRGRAAARGRPPRWKGGPQGANIIEARGAGARRPGSSSRLRSARWCSRSSRW